MRTVWPIDTEGLANLDPADTRVLNPKEERRLLRELAECKVELATALADVSGVDQPQGADDPQALAKYIAESYRSQGGVAARLSAIHHRYAELRSKLALANVRLVAHVAKRFRDRGVAYSDLLQDGFCGLLEAIDRFDVGHGTKLSTYATWWIRQAIQRAVAAGAYPVRLSPRHLRQLAESQEEIDRAGGDLVAGPIQERRESSSELIQRIHTATRPAVSLNAALDPESEFSLLQTMSDPEGDATKNVDTVEAIGKLMRSLPDRDQQVLSLRFGLGGMPRLSLSQVGKALDVSKERVRQIQDRAIQRLRAAAAESEETALAETA